MGRFYIQKIKYLKEEKPCSVCKENKDLTVHHILPKFLGKGMPRTMFKQYRTEIVCRKCHDRYEEVSNNLRNQILDKIGFSYRVNFPRWFPENGIPRKVRRYAESILINGHCEKKYRVVSEFIGKEPSFCELYKISRKPNKFIPNPNYKDMISEILNNYTIDELYHIYESSWNDFVKNF